MAESPDATYNVTVYLKEPIRDGFPCETYYVNHLIKQLPTLESDFVLVVVMNGDSYCYERANLIGFSTEGVVPDQSEELDNG